MVTQERSVTDHTIQEIAWPEDISVNNSGGDFILAAEGHYPYIRLDDIGPLQKVADEYNPKGDKKNAIFYFSIWNHEDYEEGAAKIQQYLTLSLNEKANLYPIVKALMGGTLNPEYKLKPSDMIGKYFQATVAHTKANAKGQVYARIVPASATLQKKQPAVTDENAPF